jgi:lipopolysaccharide transport system ATP-binding protein
MSKPAIQVEGLGKKYFLHHQQPGRRYKALRDVIAGKAKGIFNWQSAIGNRQSVEEFWALRDVSFSIQPGEAVGIIGRNGAGKSTLLKLLSRITEPTTGSIRLRGRVASLLEVGTGFHPELTGRENIFLNGAILGMAKAEIKRKFDEIVAFAEVEKFLDTPVKRYSSGMYVRLAFAVAAHLEPEILIVDEVLAVGDLDFQKKCIGKMERVTGEGGRTVLFVSHNMDMISKLCSKAILLNAGKVETAGAVEEVTRVYLSRASATSGKFTADRAGRSLRSVALDEDALRQEKLVVKIGFQFSDKVINPTFGVVIYTEAGSPIFGSNTLYHPPASRPEQKRNGEATVTFEHVPLWPGRYHLSVWLSDTWSPLDHEDNALTFEFASAGTPLNAPSPKYVGPVHLDASWEINK